MRILIVSPRPPWPGFRGDQARAAGLATRLAERHEVALLAQQWPGFPTAEGPLPVERVRIGWGALATRAVVGGCGVLLGGDRPAQVELFHHGAFRRALRATRDRFRPDVVWLLLSRLGDALDELDGLSVVVDLVDSLGLNMAARAARAPATAVFWRREARRLFAWDTRIVRRAALATVVAERDRASLLAAAPDATTAADLERRLRVLPFGLELPAAPPARQPAPEPTLVVGGNLGYFPTVDGIAWLLREVWPALRARRPALRLLLAGARPAAAVRRLATTTDGVELVADPPDLRALTRRATVALAPLHAGSGTPIKVLEAIADGLPVVATPGAAAGLDDLPADALRVGADPASFAAAVEAALDDPAESARRAAVAFGWLRTRHEMRVVAAQCEELLLRARALHGGSAAGGEPPVDLPSNSRAPTSDDV
jgi:glycosyltransferase involved in cell wall biosynthesis